MSESKSYKPKKPDDVADQLGSLSISNQSSSTATSSTTPVVVSDREIYIPEEVRSFALTSGCYTMTTSRSKPAETVTTDSKRDQNWKKILKFLHYAEDTMLHLFCLLINYYSK